MVISKGLGIKEGMNREEGLTKAFVEYMNKLNSETQVDFPYIAICSPWVSLPEI